MSRPSRWNLILASPRNLRFGTLVLLLIMVNQINDQLVEPTFGQALLYWGVRPVVLLCGLWLADGLVARSFAGRLNSPEWLKPVVLVSANRLGALNHTLLTANAIAARGLQLAALVLNHLEEERDIAMVSNKAVLDTWLQPPLLAELMPGQDWLDEEVVEALAGPAPATRP